MFSTAVREGEMLQNTDQSKKKNGRFLELLLITYQAVFSRKTGGGCKMKNIEKLLSRLPTAYRWTEKYIERQSNSKIEKKLFWRGMKKLLRHLTRFAPSLAPPAFSLGFHALQPSIFFFSWFQENRGSLHFLYFFVSGLPLVFFWIALLFLRETSTSN